MIEYDKNPDKMSEHELRSEVKEHRDMQKQRDETPDHWGPYGPVCMNIGKFDAGECYICYAKRKKQEAFEYAVEKNAAITKAAEMQLVAGRYQYLHEQAMKCINKIDDYFEYPYLCTDKKGVQETIQGYLATFTKEVSKLVKNLPK